VVVVLVFCARRALVLVVREDCAVVTVDAVVVSVGVPGGNNELMSSVGDSVEGVCRRVLRRTATVLRDCGLPEEFGIGEAGLLLLLLSLLFLMLLLLLLLLLTEPDCDGRVRPRDVRDEVLDLAEDHISVSVRGDLERLFWDGGGMMGGGSLSSMSMASAVGSGGSR
jgi:hypothetical protein